MVFNRTSVPGGDYLINNSFWFDGTSSALNRDIVTTGDRTAFTFSFWVKRIALGSNQCILYGGNPAGSTAESIRFDSSDRLQINNATASNYDIVTNRVFRDLHNWYHIVVSYSSTDIAVYVNGVEETSFATETQPSSYNTAHTANDTDVTGNQHNIGGNGTPGSLSQVFEGYLAEVHFVDGQSLDASSFGEFDLSSPLFWKPKAYSGSYGTTGFHLDMSDAGNPGYDTGTTQNLIPNSYDLSATGGWTEDGSPTFTADYGTNAAGTANRSILLRDQNASGNSQVYRDIPIGTEDSTFTQTIWLKGATNQTSLLLLNSVFNYVNVSDGTTETMNSTYTITGPDSNGYYKISLTESVSAISNIRINIYFAWSPDGSETNDVSLQGDIECGGIMLTEGSRIPDSYVETTGTAQTGNHWESWDFTSAQQTTDTPTNNHAVLSGLHEGAANDLSEGSLRYLSAGNDSVISSLFFDAEDSDGYYFEITCNTIPTVAGLVGIMQQHDTTRNADARSEANSTGLSIADGDKVIAGSQSAYGTAPTTGQVLQMVVKGGAIWFGINDTWMNSATQSEIEAGTTTNAAGTGITGFKALVINHDNSTGTKGNYTVNFGQTAFSYTQPSGTKTLCADNMDIPAILDPSIYVGSQIWTGNGTAIGSGGLAITGVGFQPDLVVAKARAAADEPIWVDSTRGGSKGLFSSGAAAEATNTESISTFDSDGITVGSDNNFNDNAKNYVGWFWKEGATPMFEVVTYTGDANTSQAITHTLGVSPEFVIIKNLDAAQNWRVFHTDPGVGETAFLNSTAAWSADTDRINAVSSSTFTVQNNMNNNGQDYVAYVFAPVANYSMFGTYNGNGSSDGPFVWTGFHPTLVIIKSDAVEEWSIQEDAREPFNRVSSKIQNILNATNSETDSSTRLVDWLSNGFKIKHTNTAHNTSGQAYRFAAFAATPEKSSNAH